ncbi:hypothetical protein SFUMM280S_09683 [Streptomyces fumanus]
MAGLAESGSNPDVDLLYDINGLAKDAPHWFDRVMEFTGEYGLLFAIVLLVLACWWTVRRRAARIQRHRWPRSCGRRSPASASRS